MAPIDVINIRRVVLGIAGAVATLDQAITAAAELARRLDAELTALFVEDALLFDAATLPWLRTLEPRRLVWQSLSAAEVAESHALAARAIERRLLDAAAAFGVTAALQVVRGDPATTLAQRSEPSDLLVIAEPADPIARATHPYVALLRGLAETRSAVLYVPHGARSKPGPVIVFARSAGDAALALAAAIARALSEPLVVISSGANPQDDASIAVAAHALAGGDSATLRLDARASESRHAAMRRVLAAYRERLLIVARPGKDDGLEDDLALARERATLLLAAA